ncbi:MAG: nicotinate-nucleotide adenylyltransferase [Chloroflexota bacterium]
MNVGIFGGTFDPIHNGHLAIAEEARTQLGLAKVYLVPAGIPWQKEEGGREITVAEHRLEMVRLAVADNTCFGISEMEIERPGPSYTIDTVITIQEKLGSEAVLYLILGWDSLEQLPEWHEAADLVQRCYLVAAPRPGYRRPDLKKLEKRLPGISGKVMLMAKPRMSVSSTEIRERLARGLSARHLIPETVNRYIRRHHLYEDR